MPHDLAKNKKTGKAAYVGAKPAWHRKGVVLGRAATAEEAMKHAGLDWEVIQKPIFFKEGRKQRPIDDKVANVRSDTGEYLGTVGNVYEPLQNKDAFAFFDPLVDRDEAIYETAGALGKGERIWLLAKLPDHIRVGKDDKIEKYVLLYNSHNGTSGIVAAITPIRVVCNNTLSAALSRVQGTQSRVSIRHTKNAKARLKQAHEVLGISNLYYKEMEKIFGDMAKKEVTVEDVKNYFEVLYPTNDQDYDTKGDKIRKELHRCFEEGVGQDMPTTQGTVFGLYNAATLYLDHEKEHKDDDKRLESIWWGGSKRKRQEAFNTAVEMTYEDTLGPIDV